MRNVFILLALCCFSTLCAMEKTDRLSQIVVRAYFSDLITETDLDFAGANGLSNDAIQKMRDNRGYLEPGEYTEFAEWLTSSLRKNNMDSTDVFRLALIIESQSHDLVFDYERHDEIIESLHNNIETYIADTDNRKAWNLIAQTMIPVYNLRRTEWHIISAYTDILYFLKKKKSLSPLTELALLSLQESAFIASKISLTPQEVDSHISRFDSLAEKTGIPEIKQQYRPIHLLAKIAFDYETYCCHKTEFEHYLQDSNINTNIKTFALNTMGNNLIAMGHSDEGERSLSLLMTMMEKSIQKQNILTTTTSDYISLRMFMSDHHNISSGASPIDDRQLLHSLINRIDSTVYGNRCKAIAIAPYITYRSGQTSSLPSTYLARMYLEYIESDPYQPYRLECIANASQWLFDGGSVEEAINLLESVSDKAVGMPYQEMVLNRSLSYIYNTIGDNRFIDFEKRAVENIMAAKRTDHLELHDIYTFLMNHYSLKGQMDEALRYAALVRQERKYLPDDPWLVESDWQVEMTNIFSTEESKRKERLLNLYNRAVEMEFYKQIFDTAYELSLMEMAEGNKKEARKYMDHCYEINKMAPALYGGTSFFNEYLNHLYCFQSDRGSWQREFSVIINEAERTHSDLIFPFIQLLCSQLNNSIYSKNFHDCYFTFSLLISKANTIKDTLKPEDEYALLTMLDIIARPIASFIILYNSFLYENENNLSEIQKTQLLSQFDHISATIQLKEWILQLINNRETINATPLHILSLANIYIHLNTTPATIGLAQSEMEKLREWADKNNMTNEFENETIGTRIDIAYLSGNIEQWISLIDNDNFWDNANKGIGNIDMLSSNMMTLIHHYIDNGDFKRAKEISFIRYRLVRDFIDNQYFQLSNAQKDALTDNNVATAFDLHFLLPHDSDSELLETAFNASIYYKNLLLDSDKSLRRAVYASEDSTQIADYEKLLVMKKNLDLSKSDISNQSTLTALKEFRALEDSVRNRALRAGTLKMNRKVDLKAISDALTNEEAAVEFISTKDRYGALILRKGDTYPIFVELISYDGLNYCMEPLAKEGANISPKIRRIYSGTSPRGKKLYHELWLPIEKHLEGITRIYYSPVGALSLLAIGAIQDSTMTATCQRYDIRYVSTIANIATNNSSDNRQKWTALAIGDVKYDLDTEIDSTRSRDWKHLNNSIAELQHFDSICRKKINEPILLTGKQATEKALRDYSGRSPSLMLMSTHGFYFNAKTSARHSFYVNKGLTQISDSIKPNYGIPSMKRGGLIMANANPAWNNDRPTIDDEDGILTADEIALLDFSGTDLLVLSACQTGLGDVSLNEGVFGLQRGFKLAGVNSMILSLWEVNDVAASEFMGTFYESLFTGAERHTAFRDATLSMRRKYPSDPFRWAMFVMLD